MKLVEKLAYCSRCKVPIHTCEIDLSKPPHDKCWKCDKTIIKKFPQWLIPYKCSS